MIRDTKGTAIATLGPTGIDPIWQDYGDDPGRLAELLLPVLPSLQHRIACWPERALAGQGPPTTSQLRAVAYLAEHDALPMSQLASGLQLSRPATSELIDRLLERRAVTRTPHPSDRRQVMISLTPEARQQFGRIRGYKLERLTRVIARLDPEQRQGFVRGMLLLAEELRTGTDESAACPHSAVRTTSTVSS